MVPSNSNKAAGEFHETHSAEGSRKKPWDGQKCTNLSLYFVLQFSWSCWTISYKFTIESSQPEQRNLPEAEMLRQVIGALWAGREKSEQVSKKNKRTGKDKERDGETIRR